MGALRGRDRGPFLTLHNLGTLPKRNSQLQWKSTGLVGFVLGTKAGRVQLKGVGSRRAAGGLAAASGSRSPPSLHLPSFSGRQSALSPSHAHSYSWSRLGAGGPPRAKRARRLPEDLRLLWASQGWACDLICFALGGTCSVVGFV